ncbi:transporter substrate-binding domain-containing protein [Sulfurospirillum sp. 1612]|uniref:transporter substrate-binding domain-containing protein n=1 Tax=Sulfurospirillum sp. 1612 TaxID=3094835 RepID=UPI002F94E9A6
MRKVLVALLLMLGIHAMADDINLWQKSTLNAIVQRGELRVGLDPGYMPFEMKDKKGKLIGFDIDIARAMAKGMGVKLVIVPTAWDGIIAGLLAGKYDIIIAGMTITQKRNLQVSFATPYISVGQTLLAQKKFANKTWRDLDKPQYTIVTKIGTTGEIVAKKMFKHAKVRTFDSQSDAAQEVINGKADAFIYDKPANAIFYATKGKGKIVHLDHDLTYEPLGFAIKQGDPDFINWLDNFLNQIKNDGLYQKMYNKWFNDSAWQKRVL